MSKNLWTKVARYHVRGGALNFVPQIIMPTPRQQQLRGFSSKLRLLDIDDDLDAWPKSAVNTLINVCPQGEHRIIERLGKFHRVHSGGWFFAIPIIDDIRFCVDMRERTISITAQSSITKDNVHVEVSGNLYCQFNSAEKAAYGSKNPIYAVKQHAQSGTTIKVESIFTLE